MFLESFNPLKDHMIQILDVDGTVLQPEWMPDVSDDLLVEMYQTMVYSRLIDQKVLQYQRQGRILTYAPNLGQEAAQVGSGFAMRQTDWVASAFRELGVWLRKGAPLYNILLYWYGNEAGMKMPESVRILPVSVPIASQLQHATGLAYASRYKGEEDVTIGYVGDGGTSQGDFHEALNFAAVNNTPNVFIVQNNQFAISTRTKKQTVVGSIAQKALAYGIKGIKVDGNDLLAMYAVTKEAVERARSGQGPTLIEAYTYRMGAHTTADDPSVYRDEAEVKLWEAKDPIDRMRKYLISKDLWNEEKEEEYIKEKEAHIKGEFLKVESSGLVSLDDVFNHVYAEKTRVLKQEYEAIKSRYQEV